MNRDTSAREGRGQATAGPGHQRRNAGSRTGRMSRRRSATSVPWKEIVRRYPGEWLLVTCDAMSPDHRVRRGRVLAHSPSKAEIYKALLRQRERAIAIEYGGDSPPEVAVMFVSVQVRP